MKLIYDSSCGFCRRLAARAKRWAGPDLELNKISAFSSDPNRTRLLQQAVMYVDVQGEERQGAAAFFALLSDAGKQRWLWRFYQKARLFRWGSDVVYHRLAKMRPFLSRAADFVFGPPSLSE